MNLEEAKGSCQDETSEITNSNDHNWDISKSWVYAGIEHNLYILFYLSLSLYSLKYF